VQFYTDLGAALLGCDDVFVFAGDPLSQPDLVTGGS